MKIEEIDERITVIQSMLRTEKSALKRKKTDLGSKMFTQTKLFGNEAREPVCRKLFEVPMDVSKGNMNDIFSPMKGYLTSLQKELIYLQKLKVQAQECSKKQKKLF
jgi:hypothetical protein